MLLKWQVSNNLTNIVQFVTQYAHQFKDSSCVSQEVKRHNVASEMKQNVRKTGPERRR